MKNLFFSTLILLSVSSCTDGSDTSMKSCTMAKPVLPEWAYNAVLYECNIRQFSPDGNLAGVTARIPRLKELGIDILWLMPVHPIGLKNRKSGPGDLGSPYSVRDYYAINPDFGTKDDLKKLVTTAHEAGLREIGRAHV